MKQKAGNLMANIKADIEYGLRRLCGRPSPLKRFIVVLVIGGVLTVANIYIVVNSVYNIGKRDVQKEFIELQHIEAPKLQQRKDSLDLITNYRLKNKNQEYEYDK